MPPTPPMEHIKALCAEIGPRGPTTEAEARAAAYAAAKLEEAGATDVSVELFRSVPSLWWALGIAFWIPLASPALYWRTGGEAWVWSILSCAIGLFLIVAEFSFWEFSLSNFLPRRLSQNVHGRIPSRDVSRKKLVVIGHLDTNRTPIFFHPCLVRRLPLIMTSAVSLIALMGLAFSIGALTGAHKVALIISLILSVPVSLMVIAIMIGEFCSPFTEGANDNASAVAVVLSLAERFAREPLEQTEVWALCTGCEEATLSGIKAFLDKHGDELRDAWFVDLEGVGIGELRYITCEGMLRKYHSNPGLIRAAAETAETIGDDKIVGMPLESGYTETAIVLKEGFSGITIVAMPEGADSWPHWHQVSDRIDNIEPETVDKALEYVVALARELDSG